ncbi:MAG: TGS domain-containing protein [Crocosphaera sp.]
MSIAESKQHYQHIVPDVKSLLLLIAFDLIMGTKIIKSNETAIKLSNNLHILDKLIHHGELYLECSCSVITSCIRYLEIKKDGYLITDEEFNQYIEKLLEIVRVKDNHYDSLLQKAHKLRPYSDGLAFEDILGLVHAQYINAGIMLNNKRDLLNQWRKKNKNRLDASYLDIEIHDINSLVKFIQDQDLFSDILNNRNIIRAYTPDQDIIELPVGATPVDFAYKLHTSIGHRCSGSEINGELVPLNTILNDGDVVKIIKNSSINQENAESPDLHWLSFVKTNYAAKQIIKWHKKSNIERGEKLLKQEFGKRYSLNRQLFNHVAKYLNCGNTSELLEKLGAGSFSLEYIKEIIQELTSIRHLQ